ncbi:hypothetical protein B0H14DRAFT_3482637 [Mycena olivaceomarginata]|nr:hypothetical protein B0H14DRAFT_3482637 [Mycena olivaceomarginata]
MSGNSRLRPFAGMPVLRPLSGCPSFCAPVCTRPPTPRLPSHGATHARPTPALPLRTCRITTAPPLHRSLHARPLQAVPVPSPPRCCILSLRLSHPASTPLPQPPPMRCHARSVQPPPAPALACVVYTSAVLATPFRPVSTCAAPCTLFGTPLSLCAHRTLVSFAAGSTAATPVLFRLHPHMLRALVPVPIHVHTCTSRPCTPGPSSVHARARFSPSTHPSLYRHASLVIRTAAALPSCALPPPFCPASSSAWGAMRATRCPSIYRSTSNSSGRPVGRDSGASKTPIENIAALAEADCDTSVTLDCLRALYNLDFTPVSGDVNTVNVVEFARIKSLLPTLIIIEGGDPSAAGVVDEASLDIELMMGLLGPGQNLSLYQFAQTNTSLDPNCSRRWTSRIARSIVVSEKGRVVHVSGTSASAPIFASLIAAVNDARLAAGKGPVGSSSRALLDLIRARVHGGQQSGC